MAIIKNERDCLERDKASSSMKKIDEESRWRTSMEIVDKEKLSESAFVASLSVAIFWFGNKEVSFSKILERFFGRQSVNLSMIVK